MWSEILTENDVIRPTISSRVKVELRERKEGKIKVEEQGDKEEEEEGGDKMGSRPLIPAAAAVL